MGYHSHNTVGVCVGQGLQQLLRAEIHMHTTTGHAFSKQLISYEMVLVMNRYKKKIIHLYNPP